MARYVLARKRKARLAAGAGESDLLCSLRTLQRNVDVVSCSDPGGPDDAAQIEIFDADPDEMRRKKRDIGSDVWLEPEIEYWPQGAGMGGGEDRRCAVFAVSQRRPVAHAEVTLLAGAEQPPEETSVLEAQHSQFKAFCATTDKDGVAEFSLSPSDEIARVFVSPVTGYWEMVVGNPNDEVTIECPRLPFPDDGLGWWHRLLGVGSTDERLGNGIRVGVVDTGAGPHPALEHVTLLGAWVDNDHVADMGTDVESHGTHVCGIIGARRSGQAGWQGVAPGVDLYAARVFDGKGGAKQYDVAKAIRELSASRHVDLINLSLGSPNRSHILEDAIVDAWDAGSLCICAAGNSKGDVMWPARCESAIAVSALGKPSEYPPGSVAAAGCRMTEDYDAGGGLHFADSTCFGAEVDCCGPGVGIISTVPVIPGVDGRFWASMTGTSMAAPAVCGALAIILARNGEYLGQSRDGRRARMARKLLHNACRRNRANEYLQGRGMPVV